MFGRYSERNVETLTTTPWMIEAFQLLSYVPLRDFVIYSISDNGIFNLSVSDKLCLCPRVLLK